MKNREEKWKNKGVLFEIQSPKKKSMSMHFQCWKSTRRRDKILILWTLFSIQLLLIGVFVLFGTSSNNLTDDNPDDSSQAYRSNDLPKSQQKLVKFLTNDISSPNAATILPSTSTIVMPPQKTFHDAYFECRTGKPANFTTDALFCYRNGSVLPVSAFMGKLLIQSSEEDEDCVCKCQVGYHGRDCSQPESVWRAFMTTRLSSRSNDVNQFNERNNMLVDDTEPKPRRIFYLIGSSALSLTTVEIQFMELHDLIDLLVLCDEIRNGTSATHGVTSKYERFRYHQRSNEHSSSFFLKQMRAKILILETRHKCTSKWMYRTFHKHLEAIRTEDTGSDILLYSAYDEILNRQAIEYLKWNNEWLQVQPIRFRLKYTVYGFYWQHPTQTILGSAACQLHVLDELYKGDPKALMNVTNTGMIIGDLNHYGGWFCQYCYESSGDVALKVQRDRFLLNPTNQPNHLNRNDVTIHRQPNQFDSTYMESLISAGVNVDGKMNLLRLHRYSDKYYAPDAASDKAWKYESLLTNTYAHYDGDVDE